MSIKKIFSVFGLIFICFSCTFPERDYPEIAIKKVLHVAVEDSTTSDLLQYIEQRSGWKVEITSLTHPETGIQKLNHNIYDILAWNIPVTSESKKTLAFTTPVAQSKLVLVQRKEDSIPLIRNQMELANKMILVVKNSSAVLRLRHLSEEIAEPIIIREINRTPEQLMKFVADKHADLVVVDQAVAVKQLPDYPELDIETDIGFMQFQAWGIRKNAPVLRDSLNVWIEEYF
jgi:ABC-type amino acid transport substrate-binding protein